MKSVRSMPQLSVKVFDDLYIDFAFGFRVQCLSDAKYIVKVYDNYTDILHHVFETEKNKIYCSDIKYFIRWKIQIYKNEQIVCQHVLNLNNQLVIVEFAHTIGDCLANISAIDEFQKKHNCRLVVVINNQQVVDILKNQYKNLQIISDLTVLNQSCYAYYLYALGNVCEPNFHFNLFDFRFTGLQRTAAILFNIDEDKIQKAKLDLSYKRTINDKYVVISTKSSSEIKDWIKENWIAVVQYLKSIGYVVYQIGKDEQLIEGCVNLIGNINLQDRVNLIHYADMFIGLSSGLSWIANCCNIPVVLICPVTFPGHQFYTKYRVNPTFGCSGCFHIVSSNVTCKCRNKEKYICKNNITIKQVCKTIDDVIKNNNLLTS